MGFIAQTSPLAFVATLFGVCVVVAVVALLAAHWIAKRRDRLICDQCGMPIAPNATMGVDAGSKKMHWPECTIDRRFQRRVERR